MVTKYRVLMPVKRKSKLSFKIRQNQKYKNDLSILRSIAIFFLSFK